LAPALVQADLDIVPIIPEPEPVETDANPPSLSSALKVGLRDSVRYCFVDSLDDDAFVTIVDSQSNPDLGLLNKNTAVARALLGAAIGQEREVALPMGKRRLRVLEILAPTQR
jgi:transcription elongation GreA/GreB family factor